MEQLFEDKSLVKGFDSHLPACSSSDNSTILDIEERGQDVSTNARTDEMSGDEEHHPHSMTLKDILLTADTSLFDLLGVYGCGHLLF